jgi:hypothetical protein
MHMIGHETVGQYTQTVLGGMFGEQFEIDAAQTVMKEHVLTAVTALGYVVR